MLICSTGASAIAVPGEIAGYWEAHQRFGKLKWSELFQEAIKLAEEGYEVNSALAGAINSKRSIIMDPSYNLKYCLNIHSRFDNLRENSTTKCSLT